MVSSLDPAPVDFASLYRELVLEHNRNPRHRGLPGHISHRAVGDNPLCGDRLEIGLDVRDGQLRAIGFEIEASALTVACCSMLCDALSGLAADAAQQLARSALDLFTANPQRQPDPALGGLNALIPVLDYPNRIKTVTLPIVTVLAALAGRSEATTDLDQRGEQQA